MRRMMRIISQYALCARSWDMLASCILKSDMSLDIYSIRLRDLAMLSLQDVNNEERSMPLDTRTAANQW